MTKRIATMSLAAVFAATFVASAHAAIIAGWDQNDNSCALCGSGFGFAPSSFPQANDHGPAAANHDIANFESEVDINGNYVWIQSFAGTTVNDLESAGSGGSFSFQGGVEQPPGGVWSGNGSQSVFTVPTTGYSDINVSWAQRGTATGFNSRVFEYSTDGGTNWTDIGAYNHTDTTAASSGALTSTFKTVSLDMAASLDNNPNAMFRITYSGASSATGNNRWDNFYVQGVAIPEPASLLLLSLGGIALVTFNRRKS